MNLILEQEQVQKIIQGRVIGETNNRGMGNRRKRAPDKNSRCYFSFVCLFWSWIDLDVHSILIQTRIAKNCKIVISEVQAILTNMAMYSILTLGSMYIPHFISGGL